MSTQAAQDATPREIQVGPYRYAVDFDGETCHDFDYLGVCLQRSRRIKLDPLQSDTEVPQTFLHETIHALGQVYEIPEWSRHTTDNQTGKITDKIDLMATALLQFLRANPGAVDWLMRQG